MADLKTGIGIIFKEMAREAAEAESAQEDFERGKIRARRVFKVAWEKRHDFIFGELGGARVIGGRVVTIQPTQYPDLPGVLARSASARGFGPAKIGDSNLAEYDHALITVEYETPDPLEPIQGEAFLTEQLTFGGEYLTMPNGPFRFPKGAPIFLEAGFQIRTEAGKKVTVPENQDVKKDPVKSMPTAEYSLQLHKHPNPPWDAILDLLGTVNLADFAPLRLLFFPAGTLRFVGAQSTRETLIDPLGNNPATTAWNVTYKFVYRRIPWNLLYVPWRENGWTNGWALVLDGADQPLYQPSLFQRLIPG